MSRRGISTIIQSQKNIRRVHQCPLPHTWSRRIFGVHRVPTLADTLNPSLPLAGVRVPPTQPRPHAMITHTRSHPFRDDHQRAHQRMHRPSEMEEVRCITIVISLPADISPIEAWHQFECFDASWFDSGRSCYLGSRCKYTHSNPVSVVDGTFFHS